MADKPPAPVLDYRAASSVSARLGRLIVLMGLATMTLAAIEWLRPGGAMRSYRTLAPERFYAMRGAALVAMGLSIAAVSFVAIRRRTLPRPGFAWLATLSGLLLLWSSLRVLGPM